MDYFVNVEYEQHFYLGCRLWPCYFPQESLGSAQQGVGGLWGMENVSSEPTGGRWGEGGVLKCCMNSIAFRWAVWQQKSEQCTDSLRTPPQLKAYILYAAGKRVCHVIAMYGVGWTAWTSLQTSFHLLFRGWFFLLAKMTIIWLKSWFTTTLSRKTSKAK